VLGENSSLEQFSDLKILFNKRCDIIVSPDAADSKNDQSLNTIA